MANEVLEWESEIVLPMSLSTQAWVLVLVPEEVVGFMLEGMRGMAERKRGGEIGDGCVEGGVGEGEDDEVESWICLSGKIDTNLK